MYIMHTENNPRLRESLAAVHPLPNENSPAPPLVLLFPSQLGRSEEEGNEGEGREGVVRKGLIVGCIKTAMVKKVGEGGRQAGREGGREAGRQGGREGGRNDIRSVRLLLTLSPQSSGDVMIDPLPPSHPHSNTFSFDLTKVSKTS